MENLKVELLKIEEIKEYENNSKLHPEHQIEQIANSILKFGFNDPIAIDETNTIIEGHGRLLAGRKLKLETVPVIRLSHLSDTQKRAYIIAHNKLTLNSGFDQEILKYEINALKVEEFDLKVLGFEDFELLEIENAGEPEKEIIEDEVPEADETKIFSKTGDLYILGNHKLLCGNSTNMEDVKKLMGEEKADLGFNDPPYGMKKQKEGVNGDNLNFQDLLEFNKKWIAIQFEFLKENGSFYCWGIDEPLMDIYSEIIKPKIKKQECTFRNLITWNKG
ncbi:MAG: ParB N-terminal domain-containing protein, partial [Fusobacteriaceae bacterium]